MKKKKLLLTLLALAIVTSVTAGTLAIYTKEVTLHADVQIKKFAFAAVGNDSINKPIKLAPKESQAYNFDVTNFEGANGAASEVPLNYSISVKFEDANTKMPGLSATLYKGSELIKTTTSGSLSYDDKTPAGDATTHSYKLVIAWDGDGDHNTAGKNVPKTDGLNIIVNATQDTSAGI